MDFENAKSGTLHTALTSMPNPILLRLLKEPIPDAEIEISFADLVEADFPGYSPQTLSSLDETEEDNQEIGELLSETVAFTSGDVVTPQGIFAWCATRLRDDGFHDLLKCEPFTETIVVDMPKQEISFLVRVAVCNDPT